MEDALQFIQSILGNTVPSETILAQLRRDNGNAEVSLNALLDRVSKSSDVKDVQKIPQSDTPRKRKNCDAPSDEISDEVKRSPTKKSGPKERKELAKKMELQKVQELKVKEVKKQVIFHEMVDMTQEFASIFNLDWEGDDGGCGDLQMEQVVLDEKFARNLQFQEEKEELERKRRVQKTLSEDELLAKSLAQGPNKKAAEEEDRLLAEKIQKEMSQKQKIQEEEDQALAKTLATLDKEKEDAEKKKKLDEDASLAAAMAMENEVSNVKAKQTDTEKNDRILAEKLAAEEKNGNQNKLKTIEEEDRALAEALEAAEKGNKKHKKQVDEDYSYTSSQEAEAEEAEAEEEEPVALGFPGLIGFPGYQAEFQPEILEGLVTVDSMADVFLQKLYSRVKEGFNFKKTERFRSTVLTTKFEVKWEEMKMRYGVESKLAKPELCYHGTSAHNIPSIASKGLLVPGKATGVAHATDAGYYGKGIYLSPQWQLSAGYARDNKMLVVAVLRGKCFTVNDMSYHGKPLKKGYDSHQCAGGSELVIFAASQILPLFLVYLDDKTRQFAGVPKKMKKGGYDPIAPPVLLLPEYKAAKVEPPPPPPPNPFALFPYHKAYKKGSKKKKGGKKAYYGNDYDDDGGYEHYQDVW